MCPTFIVSSVYCEEVFLISKIMCSSPDDVVILDSVRDNVCYEHIQLIGIILEFPDLSKYITFWVKVRNFV